MDFCTLHQFLFWIIFLYLHKDFSEKSCLGPASYQDTLNVWMFLAFKPETGKSGGEATASYVLHIAKSEIPEEGKGEFGLDIFVP